jgi:alpha-ribazole phosphatase
LTKIILIRHGQTTWNALGKYQGQSDIELSKMGIEQAERLTQNFPLAKIDAIYSSDLKRAHKTAQCIASQFNLPVQTKTALREVDFGDWEGLTYDQINSKWGGMMQHFFANPDTDQIPGGESFVQLQQRATQAVLAICHDHPDQTVVIAAHGAVNRTIIAEALHMPLRYIWSIRQDNTAVNILTYNGSERSIELMNSTEHLKK